MHFYLTNFKNLKIFYIFNIILTVYALSITNILICYKIIIFSISCIYIYCKYKKETYINGFYLNIDSNKSYLISAKMQKIKVKFIKIEYCSSWLIVLVFANQMKKFRILVFKNQLLQLHQFKALIILHKYKFLACINNS